MGEIYFGTRRYVFMYIYSLNLLPIMQFAHPTAKLSAKTSNAGTKAYASYCDELAASMFSMRDKHKRY